MNDLEKKRRKERKSGSAEASIVVDDIGSRTGTANRATACATVIHTPKQEQEQFPSFGLITVLNMGVIIYEQV